MCCHGSKVRTRRCYFILSQSNFVVLIAWRYFLDRLTKQDTSQLDYHMTQVYEQTRNSVGYVYCKSQLDDSGNNKYSVVAIIRAQTTINDKKLTEDLCNGVRSSAETKTYHIAACTASWHQQIADKQQCHRPSWCTEGTGPARRHMDSAAPLGIPVVEGHTELAALAGPGLRHCFLHPSWLWHHRTANDLQRYPTHSELIAEWS